MKEVVSRLLSVTPATLEQGLHSRSQCQPHPIPEEAALPPASGPPAPLGGPEQMPPSAPGAHAARPDLEPIPQQGRGPHRGADWRRGCGSAAPSRMALAPRRSTRFARDQTQATAARVPRPHRAHPAPPERLLLPGPPPPTPVVWLSRSPEQGALSR